MGAGEPDGAAPPDALGALAVLLERPGASAVLTDFDGTLAPIVADPATAVALPEAAAVLAALAERFAVVAVVSGRPVAFLAERLAGAGRGVRLVGVYGLEWLEDGEVRHAPGAEPWRGAAARVADAARAEFAGEAVGIEDKGASVTVHWRQAPAAGERAWAFARDWAQRTGLRLQPGRMAVEFRPPVDIDKGVVVERLAAGCAAACFVGDDAGDLAAFAALDRLAATGTRGVRLAVADEESPPELVATADMVVHGPAEALALLATLATRAAGPPTG
ncbi:MAG TPA: trehalose-phosphatase [Acidimicrobiales bacterium]|nr:trehalose-phosphatase [Acidimicrobiales bacterium]